MFVAAAAATAAGSRRSERHGGGRAGPAAAARGPGHRARSDTPHTVLLLFKHTTLFIAAYTQTKLHTWPRCLSGCHNASYFAQCCGQIPHALVLCVISKLLF